MNATTTAEPTQPMRLPEVPKRRRWLSALLGIVIFAGGFTTGAGTAVIVTLRSVLRAIHQPDLQSTRGAERLRRKLGLTAEQTAQVGKILRARQDALLQIRRDVEPRVMAELDLVDREIADVLDEGQRANREPLFRDYRAVWFPPTPKADEPTKTLPRSTAAS